MFCSFSYCSPLSNKTKIVASSTLPFPVPLLVFSLASYNTVVLISCKLSPFLLQVPFYHRSLPTFPSTHFTLPVLSSSHSFHTRQYSDSSISDIKLIPSRYLYSSQQRYFRHLPSHSLSCCSASVFSYFYAFIFLSSNITFVSFSFSIPLLHSLPYLYVQIFISTFPSRSYHFLSSPPVPPITHQATLFVSVLAVDLLPLPPPTHPSCQYRPGSTYAWVLTEKFTLSAYFTIFTAASTFRF